MKGATVFLVAFLVLAAATPAPADVITLKDGKILQGKILDGDEKGIRLQRFDTGGVIFLPWNFLVDRDRKRIRRDRGLDIGEMEIFQIPGVRIELVDRTVYEGVIAEEESDKIWLHTAQNKIPIPRSRIVRKDSITVNAVEVYPNTKLYEDKLAQMGPLDVDGHFEMGKFCIQIELYEKVIEHFGKVQELDPTYKPDFIQERMNECQTLLANQAIASLFNRITRFLYANKYKDALDHIAAMEQLEDLDEVWKSKLEEKKKEAEQKREAYFIKSIGAVLPRYIRSVAEAAGKDRNMNWQGARRYARRDFTRDLRAKLMTRFEIEEKELRDFLSKVKSYTQHKVSYGHFTWFAPGERPPKFKRRRTQQNNQRGRNSRRGNRNRQQQQQQQRQLPKQDEMWAKSTAKQRASYIHGMWAERSRDVHVVRVDRRPCSVCGSRGTTRITGTGGIVDVRCWRCRGIGSDRVVVYRVGPGDGQGNVATPTGPSGDTGLSPAERLRKRLLERRKRREGEGGSRGGDSGGDRGGDRRGFGGGRRGR